MRDWDGIAVELCLGVREESGMRGFFLALGFVLE